MTTYKIAISKYELTEKLAPGDPRWAQFNACFINHDAEQSEIMNMIYSGAAITTQHKDHWRTSTNYICGQHIGLDFDNGDKSSSLDALKADKFISKYASFLYSTMSHTEEAPRSRVIFLLDVPIMQAKNYTLASAALLWLFGTADRQCKDAVRFFYGSKGCRMEVLSNTLPLETLQKLIANYQETGQREKKKRTDAYHAPAEMQEVEAALKLIPPWGIDYGEWVNVLMAIHSEFGDGGYSLAESWGDGRGNEIERKWESFKRTGNGTGAVTIATVFGIAKNYGWRKSAINS